MTHNPSQSASTSESTEALLLNHQPEALNLLRRWRDASLGGSLSDLADLTDETTGFLDAVDALASPPPTPEPDAASDREAVEALADAIESGYWHHDIHREAYPSHTGSCQDARPDPKTLALSLAARGYRLVRSQPQSAGKESRVMSNSRPTESTQVDESGSSKRHMRQSINGCVTCPRPWSEHTAAERGEPPASQSGSSEPTWRQPIGSEPGSRSNPTFQTECDACGTLLTVRNNYSPQGDFLDQFIEARAASVDPNVSDSVTTERASAQSLVLQYLQGRDDIPEPTLSSLRALAEQDRAASAQAVAPGLDLERCSNCDHAKRDHYFGDALCSEHKAMHTPCTRIALAESQRCRCHKYRQDFAAAYAEADREAGNVEAGIGKPRHSGPPYNDQGIPM